ncbi:MAG: FAD binding domain-containing protein, partial [bacterium]|nr:FAD binding domain-containing protein [bacterium]
GGTVLTHPGDESFAVVDLQALGLDKLHKSGNNLGIGATVPLQALLESPHTPAALKTALKLEAPLNLRTMGTVAGTLVTCDGRSPFAAVMLALDAKIEIRYTMFENRETSGESRITNNDSQITNIGDFLPLRPAGQLITSITIPLNTKLAFETVARSPADKPIVCAALAQWPSARTRLVIGGWGSSPSVAMDGNETSGVQTAARNAAHDAADEWASAEYRREVAAMLAKRCLDKILHDKIE